MLLDFICERMKAESARRILLWGGVQAGNEQALRFYHRHGFRILGEFEYHGMNYDMVLELD
jgi:diamine N-acetyltransferase